MRPLHSAIFAAALALAAPLGAAAQSQAPAATAAASGNSGFDFGGTQPVEISADNGIEWDRSGKTYTARGNAVATQGDSELHADTLVASYSATGNQIDHVTATGSVKIMNPTQTAFGDRADFDQTKHLMVMTGAALKLIGTEQTVTARDAFEYWQDQDVLVAKGNVLIVKSDGTRINGDTVTSYFRKNADTNKREAFQVKAEGRVRIDTGKEVATCSHAVYDPITQIAVLTGNVVLTQNKNVFHGQRAEIDMAKRISRLLPAPGERVRSTIMPKQKSNPDTPQGSGVPTVPGASSNAAGNGPLALDTTAAQ